MTPRPNDSRVCRLCVDSPCPLPSDHVLGPSWSTPCFNRCCLGVPKHFSSEEHHENAGQHPRRPSRGHPMRRRSRVEAGIGPLLVTGHRCAILANFGVCVHRLFPVHAFCLYGPALIAPSSSLCRCDMFAALYVRVLSCRVLSWLASLHPRRSISVQLIAVVTRTVRLQQVRSHTAVYLGQHRVYKTKRHTYHHRSREAGQLLACRRGRPCPRGQHPLSRGSRCR